MMKKFNITYRICGFLLITTGIYSCQVDNYDEPSSPLKGTVMYQGKPIGVKATNGTVQLQLWQSGFGKETPIEVNVSQDGTFSVMLFNGDYRLVSKDGNGPWENRHDTIRFTLKGGATLDYPVVPYYTVSDVKYTSDVANNKLTARFNVAQVAESQGISSVFLLVNKTRFVDLSTSVKQTSTPGASGNVELTMDLSDLVKEKALFARVGVKIKNVDEAVYSTDVYRIR